MRAHFLIADLHTNAPLQCRFLSVLADVSNTPVIVAMLVCWLNPYVNSAVSLSKYPCTQVFSAAQANRWNAPAGLNINDLAENVVYGSGYHAEHPVIQCLWKVLASFSAPEQAAFLRFVTSCSRYDLDLDSTFRSESFNDCLTPQCVLNEQSICAC